MCSLCQCFPSRCLVHGCVKCIHFIMACLGAGGKKDDVGCLHFPSYHFLDLPADLRLHYADDRTRGKDVLEDKTTKSPLKNKILKTGISEPNRLVLFFPFKTKTLKGSWLILSDTQNCPTVILIASRLVSIGAIVSITAGLHWRSVHGGNSHLGMLLAHIPQHSFLWWYSRWHLLTICWNF